MSERKYFGKIREVIDPPNLIEIQLNSYVEFLQTNVPLAKRKETGLQAVFKEVFPIQSYDEKVTLDSIRASVGMGVSWISPVGPLKLSYGTPVRKQPNDRIQRLQFQIGTAF